MLKKVILLSALLPFFSNSAIVYYNFVGSLNAVGGDSGFLGERSAYKTGDLFQAIYEIDTSVGVAGATNQQDYANAYYDNAIQNFRFYVQGKLIAETSYQQNQRLQIANYGFSNDDRLIIEQGYYYDTSWSQDGLTVQGEWARNYLTLIDQTNTVFDYLNRTPSFDNLIPESVDMDSFSSGSIQVHLAGSNRRGEPLKAQFRGSIESIRQDDSIVKSFNVDTPGILGLAILSLFFLFRLNQLKLTVD